MSTINPFKFLVNTKHDEYAEHGRYFILGSHQVVPKYYLFSNTKLNKLLLHYSMGSGKSASAIFAFLYYLNLNMRKNENNKFLYPNKEFKIKPNVTVVSSWMTSQQIDTELISHPEFGFIKLNEREFLDKLENSNIESDKVNERHIKREFITRIHKYIRYTGYQGFFNMLFPEKNIAKYGQNIDPLVTEYKNGTLNPSASFMKSLENSIVVVDEMQKLYSSNGLNTYGFAVAYVAKFAEELKCKIIFLTGTMINSSVGEVPDILNIMSDEKRWFDRDEFCEQKTILDDVPIWVFKKGGEEKSIEYLKDRFLYYDQRTGDTGGKVEKVGTDDINVPTIKDVQKCTDELEKRMKYCTFLNDDLIAFRHAKVERLPREYHVGNMIISSNTTDQPLLVYAVQLKGLQAQMYGSNVTTNDDDESELSISIHDAYIPPPSRGDSYGITKHDNIYKGSFLGLDQLWKFSAIGYEMCCLCLLNAFNDEKTVVYHNKLNSFGIKQYAAILNANGFIKYGSQPVKESMCKSCRRPYYLHNENLEDRLKMKVCNEFKPVYYDYLTGDLDASERMFILKEVYNNPLNTTGNLISVLFISDVAYAGVNLYSTNNIILLSKVSNISKWKQIYNRIIRDNSHVLLPENKRYAKVYTMIVVPPNTKDSPEEKYYKKNIILNKDIIKYMTDLANASISDVLFNHPERIRFTVSNNLLRMFIHDIESEFDNIVRRASPTYTASEWKLDTYIERIKDNSMTLSFMNFGLLADSFIKKLIQRNKRLHIFRHKNDVPYVRVEQKQEVAQYQIYNTVSYAQLSQLENKRSTLNTLLKALKSETSPVKKSIIMYNICKIFTGRFEELAEVNLFWETIYDMGDEYYPDDEQNFFVNHTKKNRSPAKMVGFYYGNNIVLRDGTTSRIPIRYISVEGIPKYPYVFRIVSIPDKGIIGENSPFYLHVKVVHKIEGELIDRRKQTTGVACFSMNTDDLKEYFPKIKVSTEIGYKRMYCKELIFALCEEQSIEKMKFVYSPFEHA